MAYPSPLVDGLSGMPLDDTRALLRQLPSFDEAAARKAHEREHGLFHDPQERGRLGTLAVWLAGWRADPAKPVAKIELCMFAGAHGWLSGAQRDVLLKALKTRLLLLSAGGSAATLQAGRMGAALRVFDLAIDQPTGDAITTDAMTERACARAISFGLEAIQQQPDLLVLHGRGIGGREAAAAMAMSLFGGAAADWIAGAAADLSDEFNRACAAVDAMVRQSNRGGPDPVERLRRIGGRELAAMAGAIVAARLQRIPVILDGFEAMVATAILAAAAPGAADHCLVAGRDGTAAHDRLIQQLRLEPVLDTRIRGGDGLAGLMAADLLKTAMTLHLGVATRGQVQDLMADGAPQAG